MRKFFRQNPIFAIFLVCFLDFYTIGITYPAFGKLFEDWTLMFDSFRDILYLKKIYAYVSGIFFVFAFFGTPMIGALADRYGRKKMLQFTSLTSSIGFMLMGLGVMWKILPLLFLGRAVAGAFGSILTIINSALADVSTPETKAKNFGLTGVAFGLGFVVGTATGYGLLLIEGLNFGWHFHIPAIILFINFIFANMFFPKTISKVGKRSISLLTGFRNISGALFNRILRNRFAVVFLISLGFSPFVQLIPAYIFEQVNKFGMADGHAYFLMLYCAAWAAMTQGVVIRIVSRWWSPMQILQFSIICLSLSYFLFFMDVHPYIMMITVPVIAIFQGITIPSMMAVISNSVDDSKQGEILGIDMSLKMVASSFPIVIALIAHDVTNFMIYSGIIFTACAAVIFWLFVSKDRDRQAYPLEETVSRG